MNVDYATCRDALEHADAELDASECHGVLCGLLCASERFPEERWLAEVLTSSTTDDPASARSTRTLRNARAETERQLEGQQYEFEPMLPDDEEPLPVRGRALAHWCRGFLYGLALGGLDQSATTSEEVREVLGDFSEFTRLDVAEAEDESDALESDYAELVEYVRVGVMLVHTEMRARMDKPSRDDRLH